MPSTAQAKRHRLDAIANLIISRGKPWPSHVSNRTHSARSKCRPIAIGARRRSGRSGCSTSATNVFRCACFAPFALQKIAAVRANLRLGVLDRAIAEPIERGCGGITAGPLRRSFSADDLQTGSGTQTNMNVNEVISNRANEMLGQPLGGKAPVHPNDHVNCSQSSNDSFPTVMHIATALEIRDRLLPALKTLRNELAAKAESFSASGEDRPHPSDGRGTDDHGAGLRSFFQADG